jgi:DNA mismatch repair ATPase MutS
MSMTTGVRKKLGLDVMLGKIVCLTPQGREERGKMALYAPGEIDKLEAAYDDLSKLLSVFDKQRYQMVELRNALKHVKDLGGTFARIRGGHILSVTELFEIKTLAGVIDQIDGVLETLRVTLDEKYRVRTLDEVMALLDPEDQRLPNFHIYDAYSERLRETRKRMRDLDAAHKRLRKALILEVQNHLDVTLRPNGSLTVSKSNTAMIEKLEKEPLLTYAQETFMNLTFVIKPTEEMVALEEKLQEIKATEEAEEEKVRERLTTTLAGMIDDLVEMTGRIGRLDLLLAKAALAAGFHLTRPTLAGEPTIEITGGRHPVVEEALRRQEKSFVPIDVRLSAGCAVITGANMGGKSVSLKLIGLCAAMAQMGLFVPAERFRFSPFAFYHLSMGDEQDVMRGLSSFGAEIEELRGFMPRIQERGLLLIDELARGTNPFEGQAMTKAIVERLTTAPTISVLTTHFDGVLAPKTRHLQVRGLKAIESDAVEAAELESYMDYRLVEVTSDREVPKDALKIARLMGFPQDVLERAEEMMNDKRGGF